MHLIEIQNRCAADRINPEFLPLIDEAVAALMTIFGCALIEIRLPGSIARGDAVVGQSDLDLVPLLEAPITAMQLTAIESVAREMSSKWPIVSRVDVEALPLKGLTRFQRFVLASDSISIFGPDHLTQPVLSMPRADLARLVAPDMERLIASYRELARDLLSQTDQAEIAYASKIIGKDMLRGTRAIVIYERGQYPVQIPEIRRQVAAAIPEFEDIVDQLFGLTHTSAESPKDLLIVLDEVERYLLPIIRQRDRHSH